MERRILMTTMAASLLLARRAVAQSAQKVWRLGMLMPDKASALKRDIEIF